MQGAQKLRSEVPEGPTPQGPHEAQRRRWIFYETIKFRFRNPSRPPFSKGGELFSPLSRKDPFFPPLKRGIKGDLMAFQNAKMLPVSRNIRGSSSYKFPQGAGTVPLVFWAMMNYYKFQTSKRIESRKFLAPWRKRQDGQPKDPG